MGLDMYLEGEVNFYELREDQLRTVPVMQKFRLCQWSNRKRLHDYLVDQFADGELDHQELAIGEDEIRQLIASIEVGAPAGCDQLIFGSSEDEKRLKTETVRDLAYAIKWLKDEEPGTWRSVWYRAS